jgi:hypothetical protein
MNFVVTNGCTIRCTMYKLPYNLFLQRERIMTSNHTWVDGYTDIHVNHTKEFKREIIVVLHLQLEDQISEVVIEKGTTSVTYSHLALH